MIALALALAIQTQSCGMESGRWVCRTVPAQQSGGYDPFASVQRGADFTSRILEPQRQQQPTVSLPPATHSAPAPTVDWEARSAIMAAYNAGDCAGAANRAVAARDAEMVTMVSRLCQRP